MNELPDKDNGYWCRGRMESIPGDGCTAAKDQKVDVTVQ